jgi:hypothetical protein
LLPFIIPCRLNPLTKHLNKLKYMDDTTIPTTPVEEVPTETTPAITEVTEAAPTPDVTPEVAA